MDSPPCRDLAKSQVEVAAPSLEKHRVLDDDREDRERRAIRCPARPAQPTRARAGRGEVVKSSPDPEDRDRGQQRAFTSDGRHLPLTMLEAMTG